MGGGSWSTGNYNNIKQTYQHQSASQIFQKTIHKQNDPTKIVLRESRDSVEHPNSLGVGIAVDVTGSMGIIPEILIKQKLGVVMDNIIKHGVPDPQLIFVAVGDHYSDTYPLQPTQFESSTDKIDAALTSLYLEGNGGGNGGESYFLSWLFAARYTSMDCFEKRDIKGFWFSIGDEPIHDDINVDGQMKVFGKSFEKTITAEEALREAERSYHVFHIHVEHGRGSYGAPKWKQLLGERLIVLEDYENVAEVIATTIAMVHGIDMKSVTTQFDQKTQGVVGRALAHLNTGTVQKYAQNQAVITL